MSERVLARTRCGRECWQGRDVGESVGKDAMWERVL